jgi:hypothetical protein
MNRTPGRHSLFALAAAWVAFAGAASCLSGDDAPAGGRVEHAPQRAPMPVASVAGAQAGSRQPSDGPFTPLDQAIADACNAWGVARAWSRNVPDRDCTDDGECGDGFCDRGHCAAVWTCGQRYGQRCINGRPVPSSVHRKDNCNGICLDGRCRSCESDTECEKALGGKGFMCNIGPELGGGRGCGHPGPKFGLDAQHAPPD